jgi:hypothetical protein
MERHSPPCEGCEHLKENECGVYGDKHACKRWMIWKTRNAAKRSLAEPSVSSGVTNMAGGEFPEDEVARKELMQKLYEEMPQNMLNDMQRVMDGAFVPTRRRERLHEMIREILDD